jgi:predicted kinase
MFAGTAVVMDVSVTGKTEVASRLAEQLGAFLESSGCTVRPGLRK